MRELSRKSYNDGELRTVSIIYQDDAGRSVMRNFTAGEEPMMDSRYPTATPEESQRINEILSRTINRSISINGHLIGMLRQMSGAERKPFETASEIKSTGERLPILVQLQHLEALTHQNDDLLQEITNLL